MKNKLILTLLIGMILIPCVLGTSYEIEFSQYGEKLLEKHYILLDAKEELEISLPEKYQSLDVLNEYILSDGNIIVNDQEIAFSFINPKAIDKGNNYYLTKKISPGLDLENLTITLILDEGFIVSDEVYPKADLIGSDGRKIIVEWNFKDLSEDDSVPIFVIIEDTQEKGYLWVILSIILVGFVIWYLYPEIKRLFRKQEKKVMKKTVKDDLVKYLLDNEKLVYEEIKKEKRRGIWQKQIQIRTGLTKVKLSRVLRNLEKRKLIRKQNFGKTNKIFLKK